MYKLISMLMLTASVASAHAGDSLVGKRITMHLLTPACVQQEASLALQRDGTPPHADQIMNRMPLVDIGASIKVPSCTWLQPGDKLRVRTDDGWMFCVEYIPQYSAGDGKPLDPSNPFRRPCYWLLEQ